MIQKEFSKNDQTNNFLIRNILSLDGVESIFIGRDFYQLIR